MNALIPAKPQFQGMTLKPGVTKDHVADALAHNVYMSKALAGLLAKPNLTPEDAIKTVRDGVKNGSLTPENGATLIAQMPEDPQELREMVVSHYFQNLDTGRALTEHHSAMSNGLGVDMGGGNA